MLFIRSDRRNIDHESRTRRIMTVLVRKMQRKRWKKNGRITKQREIENTKEKGKDEGQRIEDQMVARCGNRRTM